MGCGGEMHAGEWFQSTKFNLGIITLPSIVLPTLFLHSGRGSPSTSPLSSFLYVPPSRVDGRSGRKNIVPILG